MGSSFFQVKSRPPIEPTKSNNFNSFHPFFWKWLKKMPASSIRTRSDHPNGGHKTALKRSRITHTKRSRTEEPGVFFFVPKGPIEFMVDKKDSQFLFVLPRTKQGLFHLRWQLLSWPNIRRASLIQGEPGLDCNKQNLRRVLITLAIISHLSNEKPYWDVHGT